VIEASRNRKRALIQYCPQHADAGILELLDGLAYAVPPRRASFEDQHDPVCSTPEGDRFIPHADRAGVNQDEVEFLVQFRQARAHTIGTEQSPAAGGIGPAAEYGKIVTNRADEASDGIAGKE